MTTGNIVDNEYFAWLYDKACGHRYSDEISYKKLLTIYTPKYLGVNPKR